MNSQPCTVKCKSFNDEYLEYLNLTRYLNGEGCWGGRLLSSKQELGGGALSKLHGSLKAPGRHELSWNLIIVGLAVPELQIFSRGRSVLCPFYTNDTSTKELERAWRRNGQAF